MVEHYAPKYIKGMPLGTSQDDGSGIRLGQSVGGATKHMDRVTAWRFLNPPMSFAKGIVVNKNGERFCNEMVYGATLGDAMCEDNEGKAYLILSAELFTESKVQANKALPFQRDMAKMLMYFNAKKKTDLEGIAKVYDLPTNKYQIQKNEVVFLSANTWDVSGGGNYGYNSIWVNRNNNTFDNLDYVPKHQIKDLSKLLDII